METKKILDAYRTISEIMREDGKTMDNSFIRVRSYLANKVCDKLLEENEERDV